MQGKLTGPWRAAYESDCAGFHLCGEPRALGVDCDMIADASIARSDFDRKRKSDRRDLRAGRIERCLAAVMTVKEWCAPNKVAEYGLRKWMARFREEDPNRNVGHYRASPFLRVEKGPRMWHDSAFLHNATLPPGL